MPYSLNWSCTNVHRLHFESQRLDFHPGTVLITITREIFLTFQLTIAYENQSLYFPQMDPCPFCRRHCTITEHNEETAMFLVTDGRQFNEDSI